MAEPGDKAKSGPGPHDDHDDLIGFFSPQALAGRPRVQPEPEPDPEPEPFSTRAADDDALDLFDDPPESRATPSPAAPPIEVAPVAMTRPDGRPETDLHVRPRPVDAELRSPVEAAAPPPRPSSLGAPGRPAPFGRATERRAPPAPPPGAVGLYAVYALILFAVPTFGASALIGLLAVWGQAETGADLAASHRRFQKRTLMIAAIAAVAGAVLIAAPFGVGVLILFALAVWMLARGAWGVLMLKSGRAILTPEAWLIPEAR